MVIFLDSFLKKLKAILLFNGNKINSVPVGYLVSLIVCYKDIKFLLVSLQYSQHKRKF